LQEALRETSPFLRWQLQRFGLEFFSAHG
jgi:hypothetical protein